MTDQTDSLHEAPASLEQLEGRSAAEAIPVLEERQRVLHARLTAPVGVPGAPAGPTGVLPRPS